MGVSGIHSFRRIRETREAARVASEPRILIALGVSALAVLAAAVAAVGPAHEESAEYAWPPAISPVQAPRDGWYAPLPLLNGVPASIDVRLPCHLSPPLRADGSATVLATARRPRAAEALWIVQEATTLRIQVGVSEIAAVPWPASCPLRVEVADGEIRLPTEVTGLRTGTLDDMPIVTGLFTNLDLRSGEPPRAVVRTRAYATSWSARQFVAASAAAVLAGLVFFLLIGSGRRLRPLGSLRRGLQSAWGARDASDAVVVGALLVWWIVGPTFWDDGWYWTEHRAFDEIGEFSLYYNSWGLSVPLGFWLEWLRHWVIGSTTDLVVMRLPSLLTVLLTWFICRWCLRSIVPGPPASVVRWTLAGVFLVGATSWGMTLRMEPVVSLLAVTTLAAVIRFSQAPGLLPLTIAVPAVVLAMATHTTGIVAVAPLLAAARPVLSWLREEGRSVAFSLGALLLAGLGLALILFTLDADLATRLGNAQVLREAETHSYPWWREYVRYTSFDALGGGTTIRRLSLLLLLLTVVVFLTRRRPDRTGVSALPARSVAVALVLLAFIPSKWPWHFGAFVGIGAVAAVAEVARLVRARTEQGRLDLRFIATMAVLPGVALLAWTAPGRWGAASVLQSASARDGFNAYTWLAVLALVAVVAVVDRAQRRRRNAPLGEQLSTITGWSITTVSFAAVGVTVAILMIDAAISSWSPTRQNLAALVRRETCSFAEELGSVGDISGRIANPESRTLVVAPLATYLPCATAPAIDGGVAEVPSLIIFYLRSWPLDQTHSPFAAVPELYELRRIAQGPEGIRVMSVNRRIPGFARADAVRR